MKLRAFLIAAAIALIPSGAASEPGSVMDFVCREFPQLSRCVAPAPTPIERPYDLPDSGETIVPKPEVAAPPPEAAPVIPPAVVWPKPDMIPDVPVAPAVMPSPQQQQPKIDTPKPRGRHERSREKEQSIQTRQQRQQQQKAPQPESGFCFFSISCSTVCEYARAGDNRRGTPCQNARGLACICSTCPEVLGQKRKKYCGR